MARVQNQPPEAIFAARVAESPTARNVVLENLILIVRPEDYLVRLEPD
jgi:hypothetical protein